MKRRAVVAAVIFGLTGLVGGSAQTGSMSALPPFKAALSVCTPVFKTATGDLAAGTAFVVRLGNRPQSETVLVTAHHLFGPNGGLPKQVGWKELPALVRSVRCTQLLGGKAVFAADAPLAVPGARPFSDDGAARDVAVFQLSDPKTDFLELRVKRPALKQRVWLVARVAGGEPETKLLHGATIVSRDREWFEFEYDNPELDIRATSGAPVVDGDGRVVGIKVAVYEKGKRLIGVAQSSRVVLGAAKKALAPSARSGR